MPKGRTKRKAWTMRMISADIFIKNFLMFLSEPGSGEGPEASFPKSWPLPGFRGVRSHNPREELRECLQEPLRSLNSHSRSRSHSGPNPPGRRILQRFDFETLQNRNVSKNPTPAPAPITLSELWERPSRLPSHPSLWERTPLTLKNTILMTRKRSIVFWASLKFVRSKESPKG